MSVAVGGGEKTVAKSMRCSPPSSREECCSSLGLAPGNEFNFCLMMCVLCCMKCEIEICKSEAIGPTGPLSPATPLQTVDYPSFVSGPSGINFTLSSYGTFIPIVFGSDKLTGNVFWSDGFTEQSIVVGGERHFYTTTSFALGIAEGEINGVLRMWVGDKLILSNLMDVDGSNVAQPDSNGAILGGTVNVVDPNSPLANINDPNVQSKVTVFAGGEDQIPAGIIKDTEGYGLTPGYRGLAYVLFENFIVTNSSIPHIYVEITANTQTLFPRSYGEIPGVQDIFDDLLQDTIVLDPSYQNLFVKGDDSGSGGTPVDGTGYFVFDSNTLTLLDEYDIEQQSGITGMDFDKSWHTTTGAVVTYYRNGLQGTLFTSNAFTGIIDHTLGPAGGIGGHDIDAGFGVLGDRSRIVVSIGLNGNVADVFVGIGGDDVGLAEFDRDNQLTMRSVNNASLSATVTDAMTSFVSYTMLDAETTPLFVDGGAVEGDHVYNFVSDQDVGITIDRITIHGTGATIDAPLVTAGITTLSYDDIGGGAGPNHTLRRVMFDEVDKTFVFVMSIDGRTDRMCKWNPLTETVVWNTANENLDDFNQATDPYIFNGQQYAWINGTTGPMYSVNLADGSYRELAATLSGQSLPTRLTGAQFYNGFDNSITYTSATSAQEVTKVFVDRITRSTVELSDIVTNLLKRVGYPQQDLTVSDLAALTLNGYTITSISSLRTIFQELAQVFKYDVVESNGKIKYLARGDASLRTITEDELGDLGENGWLEENQENEFSRTRKLALTYKDLDREYAKNSQSIHLPDISTTDFDNDAAINVDVPIVLQADDALALAEILIYSKNVYNSTYQFLLGPQHIDLDPGDVVTVSMDDGRTRIVRLRTTSIGNDYTMKVTAVQEDPTIYTDTVNLFGAIGRFEASAISNFDPRIDPLYMNIPYRSFDEAAATSNGYYGFLTFLNKKSTTIPTNAITVKVNGVDTITVSPPVSFPTWGFVTDSLVNKTNIFSTDNESTLRVKMMSQTGSNLASAASISALLGSYTMNLAYVGGELIQFLTATDEGDDVWLLSGLHRGLFGTDVMKYSHSVGETFVLLANDVGTIDNASVIRLDLAIGDSPRKMTQTFMNVNNPFQPNQIDYFIASNLRPWAIATFDATYDGSGNLDLLWQRRSRYGDDELADGTEFLALNEPIEEFEVYFFADPTTFSPFDESTYHRLETVLDTNLFQYTTAMQSTDGVVNTTDTVYINISQSESNTTNDKGAGITYRVSPRISN